MIRIDEATKCHNTITRLINPDWPMGACSPPDITVRLWTPLNDSGVLSSLYYQWFRPSTILVRELRPACNRRDPFCLILAHGISLLRRTNLR